MNNFLCSLIFLLTAFASFGQVTIPAAHMPVIGDVFTYGVHDQVYTPKASVGGVYDFSDLIQTDTTVIRYVANDKLIEYPSSNLKLVEDDNDNSTVYFKKNGNDLFLISIAEIQSQLPIPGMAGLKGTMKYLSLPIMNTTNITTTDEIKTTIPKSFFQGVNIDSIISTLVPGAAVDSFVINITLSLNMKADGTGKIKTPIDNNIDVVKVIRKITVDSKILLFGKVLGFPVSGIDVSNLLGGELPINNLNITTHTFYSPSFRQEIITATLDTTGTKYESVNYRYRTKNGSGVNQIQAPEIEDLNVVQILNKLEVRNIQTQHSAILTLYSLEGRKLIEKTITARENSIVLDKVSGIVIVHLDYKNKVSTKKIALH